MKLHTIENVKLTIITDNVDGMAKDKLTEGFGLRKNNDREFYFTKAPRVHGCYKRNPRIYSGVVINSSLRKDGQYGISAHIDPTGDISAQERLARKELTEVFKKLCALA